MGTPRQLTQIAFAAPLDESTEDEILDPTVGFPVLQNVRQDRRGGLSKRLGFAPQTTTRINGRRLFQHHDTVCVITGEELTVRSAVLDTDITVGRVPEVSVALRPLGLSVTGNDIAALQIRLQSSVCGNFLVVAYYSSSYSGIGGIGINYRVMTKDDLTPVLSGTFGADLVRLAVVGTNVIALTSTYAGSTINYWVLDASSLAGVQAGWTGPASLITDKKASASAIDVVSLTDRAAIAYTNTSGGASQLSVATFNASGLVQTTTVNTASVLPDTCAVGGVQSDTLWVTWNQGLTLKAKGLSPTTISSVLAATATVASAGSGAYYEGQPPHIVASSTVGAATTVATSADRYLRVGNWTTAASTVTPGSDAARMGAFPAARPFRRGTRIYGLFAPFAETNSAPIDVTLCDATLTPFAFTDPTLRPVGHFAPFLTTTDPTSSYVVLDTDVYGYVVAVRTAADTYEFTLVTFTFSEPSLWRPAAHNASTFLSGGVLTYFAGDQVREASFLHPPQALDASDDMGGTGPTGAVSYVAVFESVDGAGNTSWSGASAPLSYVGTGVQVFVTCDPLLMTMRTDARVSFYRTVTNGTVYYKINTSPVSAVAAATITVTDTFDDANLISQPLLFGTGLLPSTNGAPLQRDAPPFSQDVVSYNGMLVIASGSDLWWSGQTIGGEGTWVSTEQFFLTVDGPGDIVALAAQDGTLYVLKANAIYAVSGEPPSDNGSGGGLGQPRKLASDVGCVNAASLVVTNLGIWFRSARGIELLSGGRATWIGEKVQNTLDDYPDVTSAVIDARNNLVRFTLTNGWDNDGNVTQWNSEAGQDLGGKDLVFDLTLNEWQSTDVKSPSGGTNVAAQDACVVEIAGARRYAWLSSGGSVFVETDAYLDDAAWIEMSASTGWFKLSGIQGRQQFNRLLTMFRRHTACDLTVEIGYEYRGSYATTASRTNAQLTTIEALGVPLQLRNDPNDDAEGQAIRVRITDATPTTGSVGTGRGATWLALTLDITPREGPAEVSEEAA